uniref:non-specific serine/threonine protein kinase n=1 Tax=Aceria tosichella TaxID=561515 RepID=A0A6G1SFN2_9ACAR
MGNQVTTLGQIYPVEYYLVDYCNDMTLDVSLGSTRFMKVARVKHRDVGYCVAKVYAINDPSIPIQEHKLKIEQIRDTLRASGELSSLPFLNCLVNDKCVIILRQYVKYNLYDRLSTRPFLTSIEKRWLAYQLLRCIQSLHKQSIYHGDVKSENVLVTSFLWVTLADFASYKPVVLPANNPSDFSYFFDTSRRHCCNMAPERFVEPPTITPIGGSSEALESAQIAEVTLAKQQQQQQTYATNFQDHNNELTPQMDLFSLGCVLAELFSDDTPNSSIFDLGQILMFKKNKYNPQKFIEEGISDPRISRLILNLIDLEPSKRNSASYHLDQLVPSLFPAYFQTLYDYFAKLIPQSPDTKILTLNKDIDKLMNEIITEDEHGLLLLLLLATSTLRSLQSTDAKLIGLKLCVKLIESSAVMAEYIIDRLLPYIIQLISKSTESRVRALCVSSLNSVLKHVHELQLSDANVFIDYILPSLLPLAYDTSTLVRIALASNISDLTETSKRFLFLEENNENASNLRLNSIQEAFGGIVSQLLVDPNNHVRRAILNENITKLCDFFGAEKTDEVILSHIITFLNDKSDFRLRAAFFDNISCISSSLGPYYAPVVKPLMQKGLADSEEIVIYKCLNAITIMTDSNLLTKDVIYELFTDAVLFLSFPNKWIRNAVINFVLVLSKANQFSEDEFNQRILPAIKLHLFPSVNSLHDESVLLDSLQTPLPRVVIESILNGDDDIDEIFYKITRRKEMRGNKRYQQSAGVLRPSGMASTTGRTRTTSETDSQDFDTLTDNMISPEESGGDTNSGQTMSERDLLLNIDRFSEDRLIEFESILRRIHKNKRTSSSKQIEPNISIRRQDAIVHTSNLQNVDSRMLLSSTVSLSRVTRPRGILLAHLQEHKAAVNKLIVVPGSSQFISCSSDATIKFWDSSGVSTRPQVLFRSKQTFVSPDAGAFITMSACIGTDTLLALTESNNLHAIQLYSASSQSRLIQTVNFNSNFTEPELVTDLISLSPYTYATCSTSSNIRGYDLRLPTTMDVWNLKMEGSAGLITCMDGNEYCIACGTSSSVISMFDLRFYIRATTMSYPLFQDKMRKRIRRILLCNDEIYCSLDGNNEVSAWDCESASRTKTLWASPAPCLSSRHTSHQSVLSMIVDNNKESNSVITAGDDMKIRFWDLNNPHRSYIVSKPAYNSYHKLSGAGAPSSSATTAAKPIPDSGGSSSGGASSKSSKTSGGHLISNDNHGDANNQNASNNVYYQTKLVDGIQVIQETDKLPTNETAHYQQGNSSRATANASGTSASHHDSISCLSIISESGLFLSASRDGVIKIWR